MNSALPAAAKNSADRPAPSRITPMMAQYIEIKGANPDCLLFYRMGDFYELFFDDAEQASRALGIALTKRGKHLGEDIPMCGVPVHAADDYLQKLIALGYRVAVCEQMEDPVEARKRGSKAVVKRAVTRLVTPGTVTEDNLLDAGRNNYLAAYASLGGGGSQDRAALAWIDISTGEFRVGAIGNGGLSGLLAQVDPQEVLVADRLAGDAEITRAIEQSGASLTAVPASFFDSVFAEARLADSFGVKSMEGFGAFSRAEFSAAAAILAYVEKTQIRERPAIETPRRVASNDYVQIDMATRANLELFKTLSGSRKGSLLAAIDRTVTPAGSRLLASHIAAPLRSIDAINGRLDCVAAFVEEDRLRERTRQELAAVPDIARALSRIALNRGGPRDLGMVRQGLQAAARIASLLDSASDMLPEALETAGNVLKESPQGLAAELDAALEDELPAHRKDGGFVRSGYNNELDETRDLRDHSRRVIAELQARYCEETGIRSLKIRHNNVLGYFIDVTAANSEAFQNQNESGQFIHRQTLANSIRFTTVELAELEEKISQAGDRGLQIEYEIFDALRAHVLNADDSLRAAAGALAAIDVATANAELALDAGFCRPVVNKGYAFAIGGGRHPVVEQALKRQGAVFTSNGCRLGEENDEPEGRKGRIWLLTGPNMAGKSTFLRQNALIAILAQAGCYVPARSAKIGVVDSVYSRVGAADDLARGRSTFMVEMIETAAILNQAGPRSLVILDEIGRGTATFDGLSIAWATLEHLHDVNESRALFATHFHELAGLAGSLEHLSPATMRVKEWEGEVIFLHEVVEGAADRSYGIQVAKLAGLPAAVLERAKVILAKLEEGERRLAPTELVEELPLFASKINQPEPTAKDSNPALEMLDLIDPDALSPRDALDQLYELKRLCKSKRNSDDD